MLKQTIADFFTAVQTVRQVNLSAYYNAFLSYLSAWLKLARPPAYPVCLDIALTKACNLRCVFCISYTSLKGDRWMDFNLYRKIAKELFPTAVHLFFCSGGEPLLYPRIRDALKLGRQYKVYTTMVSNGMLLDGEVAEWIVSDQSLNELWVSFDGARKETLERIRIGADFDQILANIKYLADQKRKKGRTYPQIGLRYVLMKKNAEQLPALFEICRDNGIERVKVIYLNVSNEMDFDQSMFNHQKKAARIFKKAQQKADQFGIKLQLPPLPSQSGKKQGCIKPWEYLFVDSDGSLRVCTKAWRQRIGFFDKGFNTIWKSEHYGRIRRSIDSANPYFPYCRFCNERLGFSDENAHDLMRQQEFYTIDGLEHLQVDFDQRVAENRAAFKQFKPDKL